jgi:signal transduction histidine kinase
VNRRETGQTPSAVPEVGEVAAIRSADGVDWGQLHAVWDGGHRPDTEVGAVLQDIALLARIVIDRHLARRLQATMVTRERYRIAGLLHDDSIQAMTAVSLQLQRMAGRLPDHQDRQALQTIRRSTDAAIERMRHMLFSLHPTTLEDEGLEAALEMYCEGYVGPAGLAWEIRSSLDALVVPADVAALGFRLARGAVENAVKHAQASKLTIELRTIHQTLDIVVTDDGVGFDPDAPRTTASGHLGLTHARYLAGQVSGRYHIESEPGCGTRVSIEVPML